MELLTVVVTRYKEPDAIVMSCLQSLRRQDMPVHVLFLDQQNSDIVKEFSLSPSATMTTIEYIPIPAKSLSYARNYGLNNVKTNYIAFCDVDCILDRQWSCAIREAFLNTNATIVGTKIVLDWEIKPSWYMKTKYVREFFSPLDLGEGVKSVTKVVGASFAIDKSKLASDLSFDENLGRQKGLLLCGEETDFCIRVLKAGGEIYYTSYAIANHQIQKERISFTWLQKRAYYGGFSRAVRGGKIEPFSKDVKLLDKIGILPFMPAYLVGRLYGLWVQ